MKKNYSLVAGVIAVLVLVGLVFLWVHYSRRSVILPATEGVSSTKLTPAPKPLTSIKGTKLQDNPMLNQHSYLIYPVNGTSPADVKAALNGWTMSTVASSGGSMLVTLTPNNTEQEDHKQQFTVETGDKLYFVELNLSDDQNGQDRMWFDDVGILTDKNGVILNDLPALPQRSGPQRQ